MPSSSYEVSFVPEQQIAANDAILSNLLADIGRLGKVSVLAQGPADGVTPWRLEVATAVDQTTLRGIIEFIAQSDSINIRFAAAPVARAVEGEDFGFFEPASEVPLTACEGWGLFGEPAAENIGDAADGSYGLFTDTPVAAVASIDAADGSFGLFDNAAAVESPAKDEPASVTPIATSAPAKRTAAPAANAAADKGSIRVSVRQG